MAAMTDDLLAYLLDDLSEGRRAEVERRIADDPDWQREFNRLRECLATSCCQEQEEEPEDAVAPPTDLVHRTCRLIEKCAYNPQPTGTTVALSEANCPAPRYFGWTLADLTIAVGIGLIVFGLLSPSLLKSREDSRRVVCANNLRSVGTWLTNYADRDPQGHFPKILPGQNAGMFALILAERGGVNRNPLQQSLICPTQSTGEITIRIPSIRELQTGEPLRVAKLVLRLGGNYAYNIGWIDAYGELHPLKLAGRTDVPMLGDAPNPADGFRGGNHTDNGQNFLLKSMEVRFVCNPDDPNIYDNWNLNHDNQHAASRSEDDNVLLRTGYGPLGPVKIPFLPKVD